MTAECWSCVMKLVPVTPAPGLPAPLGVCVSCGVLACSGHAQRDAVSHKWKCLASVTAAVAAGAGVAQPDAVADEDVVRSVEEFDARFPRLARVTRDRREYYASEAGRTDLERASQDVAPGADPELLAVAAALGPYVMPERRTRGVIEDQAVARGFVPEPLAIILSKLG